MFDLKKMKTIHFTGIKGVGMAATACIAKDLGMSVTGSDIGESFITDELLNQKQIVVFDSFHPKHIQQVNPELLVYTAAHQGEANAEVVEAKKHSIPVFSQGEMLGLFQKLKTGISICGVGGKTTTTALLATILEKAERHPSYMIGAGAVPSLAFPGKFDVRGDIFVCEADEYACSPTNTRPKFYYQHPKIIILTSLAFDHPDIYASEEETLRVFAEFITKLPEDGWLVVNQDSSLTAEVLKRVTVPTIQYGEHANADWQLIGYEQNQDQAKMTIKDPHGETHELALNIPGKFNALNALSTVITSRLLGLSYEEIQKGLLAFQSTKRRFEKIAQTGDIILFDDYAHHPDEIKATLQAARDRFKHKKIVVIFQPHTYSRTKALLHQFSRSFTDADTVIITDIFASAREQVDLNISSEMLVHKIRQDHLDAQYCPGKSEVLANLASRDLTNSVIFTMGAGDVYKWGEEIKNRLL